MNNIWKFTYFIVLSVVLSAAPLTSSSLADEAGKLANPKENPHVPAGLRGAIIAEARANGADEDFDIPGLEDYLDTLEKTWDLTIKEREELLRMSPKQWAKLPLVIASRQVNRDLESANRDLESANRDLIRQKKVNKALDNILNSGS